MQKVSCPVDGCADAFKTVHALEGHIAGKAPHCEKHEQLKHLKRWELHDQAVAKPYR